MKGKSLNGANVYSAQQTTSHNIYNKVQSSNKKTTTKRSLLYIFCVQVRLTKHVEKLILFMEVHREIEKWLEGMSETISGLLPISEDSDEAKAQLANTKVTLSGLRKVSPNDTYLKLSDTSFAEAFCSRH